MVDTEFQRIRDQLVEQKISIRVTIANGADGEVKIPVPKDKKVYLKGYGYSWFTSNEYVLITGNRTFPMRTDQEGSSSIPMIFGNPFPCRSGGDLKLTIKNSDTATHTYDVVFYILTNDHLDIESTGGEMIMATAAGAGAATSVAIWNSAFSSSAPVDTVLGLAVQTKANTTLLCGTKATTASTAIVLAASTACKKVTIQADVANTDAILVGNATTQLISLELGQSVTVEISNLNLVYIKRVGGSNQTVNYIGS